MREYTGSFEKDYKVELQIFILLVDLLGLCSVYLLAFPAKTGWLPLETTYEFIKLEEHIQIII